MSYYTPSVVSDPFHAQAGSNSSLSTASSPVIVQQQVPQYLPANMAAPIPIPTNGAAQPVFYVQQPHHVAQSLPMYAQQPQPMGYPMPGYTYGTPATTRYIQSPVGGSYAYADGRSPNPYYYHDHHSFSHRLHCGHCRRRGSCLPYRRHRTYNDPEYDYHYRRY